MKISNSSTINQQACEWIAKLHETELSKEQCDQLKAWAAQSDQHKTELRRMAQRWDELNTLTLLAVPADPKKPARPSVLSYLGGVKTQLGVVAVAAVALFAVMLLPNLPFNQDSTPELLSYSTDIGEQRLITLPDNSTVLLNTKSQFRSKKVQATLILREKK